MIARAWTLEKLFEYRRRDVFFLFVVLCYNEVRISVLGLGDLVV